MYHLSSTRVSPLGEVRRGLGLLQHIEHLFFDLLQFVFHHHHEVLHLGLIAFGAHGVYFAAHFLGYESQFLPWASSLLSMVSAK